MSQTSCPVSMSSAETATANTNHRSWRTSILSARRSRVTTAAAHRTWKPEVAAEHQRPDDGPGDVIAAEVEGEHEAAVAPVVLDRPQRRRQGDQGRDPTIVRDAARHRHDRCRPSGRP